METLGHVLIAMAAVVAPLLLAWWLLARDAAGRKRDRPRPKRPESGPPPARDNMEP